MPCCLLHNEQLSVTQAKNIVSAALIYLSVEAVKAVWPRFIYSFRLKTEKSGQTFFFSFCSLFSSRNSKAVPLLLWPLSSTLEGQVESQFSLWIKFLRRVSEAISFRLNTVITAVLGHDQGVGVVARTCV